MVGGETLLIGLTKGILGYGDWAPRKPRESIRPKNEAHIYSTTNLIYAAYPSSYILFFSY